MTAPFRLAILGGGAVTREFYLPALARLAGRVEAVVITDPNPGAVRGLRADSYTGSFEPLAFDTFLGDPALVAKYALDAVVVAVPNALHEAAAVLAASRGLHALVEKPLALTATACHRMAAAARAAGTVLAAGMVRRLPAAVNAVREALAADLIGPIREVIVEDGSPYAWVSDSGAFFRPENGGVLADMGVHFLDLIWDLVGPLDPIGYRDDAAGGCEANCEYHLQTRTGVPVRVTLSRDRTLRNEVVLRGDRGEVAIRKTDFGAAVWRPAERNFSARLDPTCPFADSAWPADDFVSAFAQQFVEFAAACRGEGPVRCSAADAAGVIGLIERAYRVRADKPPAEPVGFGHLPSNLGGPMLPHGRVLVTGGTGFIGSRLVARLQDQGAGPIVTPVRGYRRCVELARHRVEMPRLDLLDAVAVRAAVKGCRYVFHLAYGRDGDDTARATTDGTRHVVEAAAAERCEAVVVLSTMYVFGRPSADRDVDETWPYAPIGGEYGTTKAAMEKWCLARAGGLGGTRLVILNPSCVYGVQGKTYTRMPVEMAANGRFCWVEDGRGIANHLYVENLIDAILLAASRTEAHGRRFLISDGACTWREFLTPLLGPYAAGLPSYTAAELGALERGPRKRLRDLARAVVRAPEVNATLNGMPILGRLKRLAWRLAPGTRRALQSMVTTRAVDPPPQPVPPAWLADLFAPDQTRFTAERASQVLGWTPRVGLDEAMRTTTAWLQSLGMFGRE